MNKFLARFLFILIFSIKGAAATDFTTPCDENLKRSKSQILNQLKLYNCTFEKEAVVDSLFLALNKICQLNPGLVYSYLTRFKPLEISCIINETFPNPYPHYVRELSTIFLMNTAKNEVNTWATIFHESLHHINVPIDYDVHHGDGDVSKDSVYACHVSAYPELAGRILGDAKLLPLAIETCGHLVLDPSGESVKPVDAHQSILF